MQLNYSKPLFLHQESAYYTDFDMQAVEAVTPFLEAGLSAEEAKRVGEAFVRRIENEDDLKTANQDVDEEEGEPLTEKPLKFSLAYGEYHLFVTSTFQFFCLGDIASLSSLSKLVNLHAVAI